ncbi:MAG: mechanosensitive ion channel family protein [Treponema sp.]|jgi:small-conductance mechanosensitive channel|nr:mechanosensitive ion channel family protein [Treponema sp.]
MAAKKDYLWENNSLLTEKGFRMIHEIFSFGLHDFLSEIDIVSLLHRLIIMILSVVFILTMFHLLKLFFGRLFKGKISETRRSIVKKGIQYAGFVLAVLFVFKSLGIDTNAILGAAGIASVVLGFAAQTSVSSLISGFFLLSEKSFAVGDTIKVDNTTGVVLSVDLLSVKLRTFDNLFVRIPNEAIIKSSMTNITRFPLRRLDLNFLVAYKGNLEKVRDTLLQLAAENRFSLENPAPFFGIDKLGESGITVLFNLWFESSNFSNLKTSIIMDIKKRFESEGIEIPCQRINVTVTEPLRQP